MALTIEQDLVRGQVTIEGTTYSAILFKALGCSLPTSVGHIFRVDKMEDGIVTLTRLREHEGENPRDSL